MSEFEQIYDLYSPVLYGIALKISSTPADAEILLIETFKKIQEEKLYLLCKDKMCIEFIRVLINIADRKNTSNSYNVKLFIEVFLRHNNV